MEEIKKAVDGLGSAWAEFKAENDKGRKADADKLAKIEADIAKFGDLKQSIEKAEAARKAHAEELEAKLNRIQLGAAGPVAQKDEQKDAFWKFVREGKGRMSPDEQKALSVGDDSAGGYLAPKEYVAEIIKGVVLVSPMRSIVRVRQTSQRSIQVPKRTSTAAANWVAELQTRTESTNPAYGLVEIPAHEMTAEVYVSFAELEDAAFPIDAELREEFAEQFAKAEGAAIVSGDGIGKPFGLLNSASGVGSVVSGAATTITADGIISLVHDVASPYAANGMFCLNRKTLGAVRKLKDDQKRYLFEPGLANGIPNTILGQPYMECPDMDDEGANKFPICFGDHRRAYTLVDRVQVSVVRDDYTKASVGQVKFVARRRVGGQVVLAEAVRLLKCST